MLYVILIGFIAGLIAKALMPGNDAKGFIMTTILGIAGAWVGSLIFGHSVGLIGSVLGALIILWAYRFFNKRSTTI
jgi:uncharacterized membrane protein YeaQ/YmgE (transglycosylase-associated protein family)